jgi:ATP-dependent RNA helicase DeaD
VHRIGRTGRAGNEGVAITLAHTSERWKLRQIEKHVRQEIPTQPTPTRSQIEARRLERLNEQMREALMGERLASFLPMISALDEEYDIRAIAAAALQLAIDQYPAITAQLEAELESTGPVKNGNKLGVKGERPQIPSRSSR